MIPQNIGREHVLAAIRQIDKEGVPDKNMPTRYWLMHDGGQYPPKHVIALANSFANGRDLDRQSFNGGAETNNFLKRLGFKIITR